MINNIKKTKVGLTHRFFAKIIDAVTALTLVLTFSIIFKFIFPTDSVTPFLYFLEMAIITTIFIGYFILGAAILPNTYGRYALGYKVISLHGRKIPIITEAIRNILNFLNFFWICSIFPLILIYKKSPFGAFGDKFTNPVHQKCANSIILPIRLLPLIIIYFINFNIEDLTSLQRRNRLIVSEYANRKMFNLFGQVYEIKRAEIYDDTTYVYFNTDDNICMNMMFTNRPKYVFNTINNIKCDSISTGIYLKINIYYDYMYVSTESR